MEKMREFGEKKTQRKEGLSLEQKRPNKKNRSSNPETACFDFYM